jgi:hypothetical protein
MPMPKGKRSSSLSSPSLGNIVVAPASGADKEAASGADTEGKEPCKTASELNHSIREKGAASLGPLIPK